ncbi:MAG: hypothetical protein A2157_08860 [Deltaproteobacteria bacterium RBG_16_47_11]|nr:MAG: hypothetical protein A2157_08860 [Deltaproteobacteria bacterium RBG_16_47_11]
MKFLGDLAFGDDVGDCYLLARLHHVRHILDHLNLISKEAEGTPAQPAGNGTQRNCQSELMQLLYGDFLSLQIS